MVGIPLLATPAFGIKEQILDPGVSGLLSRGVRNYNGFQELLKQALDISSHKSISENQSHWRDSTLQRLSRIGIAGKRIVEQYFTSEATMPYFEMLLKSLAPIRIRSREPALDKMCVVIPLHSSQLAPACTPIHPAPCALEGQACPNVIDCTVTQLLSLRNVEADIVLVPVDKGDITPLYPLLVRQNHRAKHRAARESFPSHGVRIIALHNKFAPQGSQFGHDIFIDFASLAVSHCSADSTWFQVANASDWTSLPRREMEFPRNFTTSETESIPIGIPVRYREWLTQRQWNVNEGSRRRAELL